jgi:hypothetical protein
MALDKLVFLDFEFTDTSERVLNLVSAVLKTNDGQTFKYWLRLNMKEQLALAEKIEDLVKKEYVFVAYAAIAEARSILSPP